RRTRRCRHPAPRRIDDRKVLRPMGCKCCALPRTHRFGAVQNEARLRGWRGRLLDESFRFGEGWTVAHRTEQLRGLAEWLLGGGVFEGEQAAALAEEGVGVLGDVPELLPACGCFGVEGCGLGVVA